MAWQLHPPVPPGPMGVSHQVLWTSALSGSLEVLNFNYSRWFFIFPVPAFDFCNLGGVAGATLGLQALLGGEDHGKIVEYLNFLRVLRNQVSHILPESP